MSKISRSFGYLVNNRNLLLDALVRRLGFIVPDKLYLSIRYRLLMGYWINWENPTLYQEKLQWLKLYDRKPQYTNIVDKVKVKDYVANIIGEQYVIPTIGIWNTFDEIDFSLLPEKFVLKTNNGGGNTGVVICKNKNEFNKAKAKQLLESSLKSSIYKEFREWPYKDVQVKILAEPFMTDNSDYNHGGLSDYKFTCFNGYVDNVMVCVDRHKGDTKFYFFNKYWNLLPLNKRGIETDPSFKLPKPKCMDEMFEIASKLSKNIPFLRVDMYCINEKPYFGEMTFYPASGFDPNILKETEKLFGEKIVLPL